MTIVQKLSLLTFNGFAEKSKRIDFEQIEIFVKGKVTYLFSKVEKHQIQKCVIDDSIPKIVNFLTHVVEVGSVKSIAFNKLDKQPANELQDYAYILTWAFNITLAIELKRNGMTNIPSIVDNRIELYYSDDALLMIVDRITHHVSLSNNFKIGFLDAYANNMISSDMVL